MTAPQLSSLTAPRVEILPFVHSNAPFSQEESYMRTT